MTHFVLCGQDGFNEFVLRCEAAEFEDAVLAQQGKMSLRDLQKMRQSAGNQYATKPASELAMDNSWEVRDLDSILIARLRLQVTTVPWVVTQLSCSKAICISGLLANLAHMQESYCWSMNCRGAQSRMHGCQMPILASSAVDEVTWSGLCSMMTGSASLQEVRTTRSR